MVWTQINVNVVSIHFGSGDGSLGHCTLTAVPAKYQAEIIKGVTFAAPANFGPDLIIPAGTTNVQISKLVGTYKTVLTIFHQYNAIDKALRT